jgi:Asp/Glu/hydantoin racemase
MTKRVALIHTVSSLLPVFKALCNELLENVDVFNIVDESLLQNTIRANLLTPITCRRLAGYVVSAEEAGADAIMVTCSSVGPVVDLARGLVSVPVLRVDQPMAEEAVRLSAGRHGRIGVAATLQTTLGPTAALVKASAAALGTPVEIMSRLVAGAFEANAAGDAIRHDALVADSLRMLMGEVDVVLLAQASMARVGDSLPAAELRVPVLSSPRLAVLRLKQILEEG